MCDFKGFENFLIAEGKSENTVSCYLRDAREFMSWYTERTDHPIDKVIELDLIEYRKHLIADSNSPVTIGRKVAGVNSFLRWMGKDIRIKAIRNMNQPEYKGLDLKDFRKIRSEIHRTGDAMHICIIELLLGTGIRVGELVGLTLQDIKMSARKGSLRVKGKGTAFRTIPLNNDVRKAIRKYIEVRRQSEHESLFIGQRGPLKRNAISLILKKYGQRVGVVITPHMLRHTLGYKLITGGEPLTTIQQILGHRALSTTLTYTQTREQDKIKALEDIEW